ncbi:MAG TPA: serine/threonine-protein kinase [Trebonia sp.]
MTSDFTEHVDSYAGVGPGSRIAGYLIEEQIGAGGMAVVFRARDEVLGRLAAVKLIAPAMANDEGFRARFLRESRTVAAVDSLHIIPVYSAGEAGGLLYIATRYVPGGDLAAVQRRAGGVLAPDRAAALITQVASALDAAHAAGLVHRDVKPQNILVDTVPERPEHAFLSDFGLSKGLGKGTNDTTGLTMSGQFLGTPDYCAPEQIRSGRVDGQADQYSLACVAFVLLTGTLPFHRDETVATMFAHLQGVVPLATRFRPELPAAVNGVLARALAKSPDERYQRCAEFARDLEHALASPGTAQARPAPVPAPPVEPARGPDPWAWLAKDPGARVPAGQPVWQPPAVPPRSQLALPSAADQYQSPPPADRQHPSLPSSAFAADWETALRQNAAYANTAVGSRRSVSRALARLTGAQPPVPPPPAGGGGRGPWHGRNFRRALIGGAAVVIIAAAGVLYAVSQHGSPGTDSPGSLSSSRRPSEPTLAETLTVPGGGTVDTVWMSQDGRFVAASGQGSTLYVWNTSNPSQVTTLTPPDMTVAGTVYSAVIDNVAFSDDDSSVTASVYPNVPSGAGTPGHESSYAVDQWNLTTDKPTQIWSLNTPSTVAFSNNDGAALTSQGNVVSEVTLGPGLPTTPPETLPGGADVTYPPPYELDRDGGRMIYHPAGYETYVWDFTQDSVVAKLRSSEYTVLSPDGKTILATNPTNYHPAGAVSSAPPTLWDVATQSNVTPDSPLWRDQLREPWQRYSWDTYSTDGSVLMTTRAGGKTDLWDTATHKYLLTITDPTYRTDGYTLVGPGGSEVLILAAQRTINGEDEYRQIRVWETPLSAPPGS